MSGGCTVRKLVVESQDEVYYPVVSILHTEKTEASILGATEETLSDAKLETKKSDEVESQKIESSILMDVVKNVDEPKRRRRGFRVVRSKIGTVLVGVVASVAIILVGLRLAGFRTFTVMSGSMEPDYPVGAMIYVQPVDYQNLKVGDVISYVANDDKTVVTHRIVDIEVDQNDSSVLRFKTKGDANNSADAKLVHYKNVLGTPMIIIPYIGYIAHNIQQPPGIYIALVVGTLLLAWTFLPDTLEERRKTARKSVV